MMAPSTPSGSWAAKSLARKTGARSEDGGIVDEERDRTERRTRLSDDRAHRGGISQIRFHDGGSAAGRLDGAVQRLRLVPPSGGNGWPRPSPLLRAASQWPRRSAGHHRSQGLSASPPLPTRVFAASLDERHAPRFP